MFDKINRDILAIVYRYKWQFLANKVNLEFFERCYYDTELKMLIFYEFTTITPENEHQHQTMGFNFRFNYDQRLQDWWCKI